MSIAKEDLKELVAREIAERVINAAFFSTYTFNRAFFEEEIQGGLLCSHGQRRGSFPVTIIVDSSNFEGQGWGYDVCCPPNDRLWHPKVVSLMLKERTKSAEATTVIIIGSGNLTPNGWGKNQELFLTLEWQGWVLPNALEQWICSKRGIASETAFGHWYRDNHSGQVPRFIERCLLGNYTEKSIWQQWELASSWTRASVVSPFTDARFEEQDNDPQGYFDKFVDYAASEKAILDVYLQGAPGGRVIGHWPLFNKLRKEVRLQVYRVGGEPADRPLHAKLQLAESERIWHILGGSPNATERAMLMAKDQDGNVELAWHTTANRLPASLLPAGIPIQLRRSSFVAPCRTIPPKRWRAMESIKYDPRVQRLKPHWLSGHSLADTRVLLDNKEILLAHKVNLGTERAVATLPRHANLNRGYKKDWVPIEYPYGESDNPIFSRPLSLEEFLFLIAGREDNDYDMIERSDAREREISPRQSDVSTVNSDGFQWYEKVASLQRALVNLKISTEKSDSPFEASYLIKMVKGCLEETTIATQGQLESNWREWVRFEVCRCLLSLDRRRRTTQPLGEIVREWKKKVNPVLRRFL